MKNCRLSGRNSLGYSRLSKLLLAMIILVLASIIVHEAAMAQVDWLQSWESPKVPADYRSPGNIHKIIVEHNNTSLARVMQRVRYLNIYPYLDRKLYVISKDALLKLPVRDSSTFKFDDKLNLIRLRDRYFDTSVPVPDVAAGLKIIPAMEKQLHLVQFVGPVKDEWLERLKNISGIKVITSIPENAYLVWVDSTARIAIADIAESEYYMQWHGPFHPAYKINPSFKLDYTGDVTATIQLATHEGVGNSIAAIKAVATETLRDAYRVGPYTNILVKLPMSQIPNLAKMNDVVNIEPWLEPSHFGERQGQIVAGNINAAGTGPMGAGYLAWLNGLGFNSNFDFAIDVSDDGFDQGQTGAANVHPDFLDAGGNSRVAYVCQVSGTTVSTTNDENCGGHGTINAAIAGGFNNTLTTNPDFDYYGDGNNYRYGLGVAPYVRLGGTKILDPWSAPDYTTIQDNAYSNGARISSNSWGSRCPWGCCPAGVLSLYTAESQEYDRLVRDARPSTAPSGGETGNQEMVILFAAGNEGNCANEQLGNNGATAKNTIVVGACENDNQAGTDGCGETNADADDINDIASFSSTGPTQDDRFKPDIMAPGTHIFGAASQDGCFNGSSVCGSATNDFAAPPGDAYFPADPDATDTRDQDLYTWSSGTSHACPAVAGGAALLRQWFLNQGYTPPSPAMTKAYLLNTATRMTGAGANDDLPSGNQGMGLMNLGMTFDNTPRLLFDQVKVCHRNGGADATEIFTVDGLVANINQPFRVTLAWTDAEGDPVSGVIAENDLDLEVSVAGNTYRGNDFTNDVSNILNPADPLDADNNVESVYLPAGTIPPGGAQNFVVTVRPTNLREDGVPGNSDATDQDFALAIYNAEFPPRNPVDIVLVLDRSGSMSSTAAGGTDPKIDLLKDAVEMFIKIWEPYSIPDDRMGILFFNNNITNPNSPNVLVPFQANANNLVNQVRAITATGCTGMGGGILTALDGFDNAPNHQKHIIVFTNGMQNCSPMVTEVDGAYQIIDDPHPPCTGCNTGVPGKPGTYLSGYDVKAIHTIGTGVSGAEWTTLLNRISSETGGEYYFTSTPDEHLEDFFIEDLVQTLRVDPVELVATVKGNIARTDQSKEITFSLNSTVRKATFALSWRGGSTGDSLTFDLVAPDNTIITPRYLLQKRGKFYNIVTADFPLNIGGTRIDAAGKWKMIIKPSIAVSSVSYNARLIVDDADLRYYFDIPSAPYAVGETIPLTFWIKDGNRTLTNLGGQIKATISRPPVGFGTFMSKNPVSKQQLDADIDQSGDMFADLAAKKAHILLQNPAMRRQIEPATDNITFYDDGLPEHGDDKAKDGIYNALYSNTNRPGTYSVNLKADVRDPVLGEISRSESQSLTVKMKYFDIDRSTIHMEQVDSKPTYEIEAVLIDSHDNYLGPGYDINVLVRPPGKQWGPAGRRVKLTDNLDGSYSGRVELTDQEVKDDYILELNADGIRVTRIEKPIIQNGGRKAFASLHAGVAIPTGSFADYYDPGFNILADLEYRIRPMISAVLYAGYNDFRAKIGSVDNTYWINISANVKYYSKLATSLYSYAVVGPGIYIPKTGNSEIGGNIGAGIDYEYNRNLTFEIGGDFHRIFDPEINFLHFHAGLIYRFR